MRINAALILIVQSGFCNGSPINFEQAMHFKDCSGQDLAQPRQSKFFSDSQKARKDDWNNVNETNTGQAIVLVFVWLHLALGDKLGLRWRLEEKV